MKRKRKNSKRRIKIQPPPMKPHLTLTLLAEMIRKNKKWKAALFLILFPLFSLRAQVPNVPHLIHFQSTLTNPAGEALPDGLYTVHFRILDPAGGEFYREVQTLETAKGVISAMVGGGGDLTPDMLEPGTPRFLGVTVEGQGPESLLEIAAVPYSLYAEKSLGVAPQSIGTESIQPGSITADLLAEDVLTELLTGLSQGGLPSVVISREELGGATGANRVGVSANFIYSRGFNAQTVLKDLDTAVHQRQINLERETTARVQESAGLQSQLNTINTDIGTINGNVSALNLSVSANISESNSRMTSIEEDIQALSAPPRVVAAGIIVFPSEYNPDLSSGFNISAVNSGGEEIGCGSGTTGCAIIHFQSAISPPYFVQVTPTLRAHAHLYVSETSAGRLVVENTPSDSSPRQALPFHFVVFK